MAAGDIIIPDNTITPAIMQKIAAEVTKLINTNAKDPGQWEVVTSTNGVTSLPVLQVMGSTYKLVRLAVSTLQGVNGREVELQIDAEKTAIQWRYVAVSGSDLQPTEWRTLIEVSLLKGDPGETPIFQTGSSGIEWKYESEAEDSWRVLVGYDVLKLKFFDLSSENIAEFWRNVPADVMAAFQKPATDAATKLTADVEKLEQRAQTVIDDVSESKTLADAATQAAADAAGLANAATGLANAAAETANTAAQNADQKAGLAEAASGRANVSAGLADEKAGLADTAAGNANAKAGLADRAAILANDATEKAEKATVDAQNATKAANDSAVKANISSDNADEKSVLADTAAGNAAAKAGLANAAAENADRATGLANAAIRNADMATGKANEAASKAQTAADRLNALSDHRDKIVDGYWWRWNEETNEWYNTREIAKGNVMFATFEVDPITGRLTMFTDPEYTGANFELDQNGKLQVII